MCISECATATFWVCRASDGRCGPRIVRMSEADEPQAVAFTAFHALAWDVTAAIVPAVLAQTGLPAGDPALVGGARRRPDQLVIHPQRIEHRQIDRHYPAPSQDTYIGHRYIDSMPNHGRCERLWAKSLSAPFEYRPIAICALGRNRTLATARLRDSRPAGPAPYSQAERARATPVVATFRPALWMTTSRGEHRKMLYKSHFVHFVWAGSVGQVFPTGPGDEPAHVQIVEPCRGQKECQGITSRPAIWHAQVGRRAGGPVHPRAVPGHADGPVS